MTKQIDLNAYKDFVREVTSNESLSSMQMYNRIVEIETTESKMKVNMAQLMTGAIGISAEGGEFMEIVKKMVFQGKPYNEDNREHLIIELGDIMWYVSQACIGLDISLEEVIQMNFEKLSARYPEGAFSIERSENRVEGDL